MADRIVKSNNIPRVLSLRPKMEVLKDLVAKAAIKAELGNASIIGVGSGSTIVYAVKYLAENRSNIKACIPTSFQSEQLIIKHGLPLATLNQYPEIDIAFDGADEIDPSLNLIKGGGGCLLQEKLVASAAKKFVILVDESKDSHSLGSNWTRGVPIEVIPLAYNLVIQKLKVIGGIAKLREGSGKAGPVVTDNGNFILDTDFGVIKDPYALDQQVIRIPGIVETGIFSKMATAIYIGKRDATVECRTTTAV